MYEGENMKSYKIKTVILLVLLIMGLSLYYYKNTNKTEYSDKIGKVSLYVETYLAGKNQLTHPNVIKFNKEWHGYKYWMGYTPYPNANGEEENPSIAASNDLYKWETPKGLANPIADNEETGCAELKDSQLIYREDLDRLEMWYLGRVAVNLGGDGKTLTLFRKISKDGVNWSKYEIIKEFKYVSPIVIWDGSKYKLWGIGFEGQGTKGLFDYMESEDGITWSDPVHCSVNGDSKTLDMWHGDIAYNKDLKKYEFVYIDTSNQNIYYSTSNDGLSFSKNKIILKNDSTWTRLYRPTLVYENNQYYVIYGAIGEDNENYITMSVGKNIDNLVGINKKDISKMMSTPAETISKNESILEVLSQYKKEFYRLELLLLIPLFFVLQFIASKFIDIKKYDIQFITFIMTILVCEIYIIKKINFSKFDSIFIGLIMGLLQGLIISGCTNYIILKSRLNLPNHRNKEKYKN